MIVTRARVLCAFAAFITFFGGFTAGYFACVHAKRVAKTAPRPIVVQPSGDASETVRKGVLRTLETFQAGYTTPDISKIDMQDLFDIHGDNLIIGTDEATWVKGYPQVVQFVHDDWSLWGDLSLNLRDPFISSWEDVAWVTTEGEVKFRETTRPLIFSAVLVRDGDKWLFRKMEFHWDERRSSLHEMLHPDLYLHTLSIALRRVTGRSESSKPPNLAVNEQQTEGTTGQIARKIGFSGGK
jgi:hypothetical protein